MKVYELSYDWLGDGIAAPYGKPVRGFKLFCTLERAKVAFANARKLGCDPELHEREVLD